MEKLNPAPSCEVLNLPGIIKKFVLPPTAELRDFGRCWINSKTAEQGYIALISVIIISVLLIALTFTVSFTGFFLRFNLLDREYKAQSSNLAEACANTAVLKLVNNPAYAGNEDIAVASDTCHIGSVSGSPQVSFKTQGIYPKNLSQKTYTNLNVSFNTNTLTIVSWDETAN